MSTPDHAPAMQGERLSWPHGWSAFLLLLLVTIAFWRVDHAFFWRDDWDFLSGMRSFGPAYLFEDHYGHVLPLTKLLYYTQLRLFGTAAIAFSYVNLVLVAATSYVILTILQRLTSPTSAWIIALVLTVHPLLFNHVGWTFEQCMSWHLLFQVLAVRSFLRWMDNGVGHDLWQATLFTAAQGYSFGNGLFLPGLFAVAAFLWKGRRPEMTRGALVFLGLFICFVVVQLLLGGDRATSPASAGDLVGVFTGGMYLLGVDTARWFFVMEQALGRVLPITGTAIFLALITLALVRKDRDRRLALFHVGWFLVTFCAVPLVRRASLVDQTIPHYYSILCLIPAAFIAEHALGGRWWGRLPTRLVAPGLATLLILVFLLDRQLMAMVSFRSFRNEQAMMQSLQDGTPYKGFDEPYFRAEHDKVEDPLGIYRYWRARDPFRMPLGYANEPSNWTRTTPLTEAD